MGFFAHVQTVDTRPLFPPPTWPGYTVKKFGLLQPYFGHLSCMPVVCVTHYKTSNNASCLNQSLTVVEKFLSQIGTYV